MAIKNKIMVGVLAALFVVAGVGVGLGIWTTYDDDSPALLPDPSFIEGAPIWPRNRIPLRVCPVGHAAPVGTRRAAAAGSALANVNREVGHALLVGSTSAEGCDVRLLLGVPGEPGWRDPDGDSRYVLSGGEIRICEVEVKSGISGELLGLVIEHELGHCLGLDHDDFTSSIMRHPGLFPLAATPLGRFPPSLTDRDARALRERYR